MTLGPPVSPLTLGSLLGENPVSIVTHVILTTCVVFLAWKLVGKIREMQRLRRDAAAAIRRRDKVTANSHDAFWAIDVQTGEYLWVSESFERQKGYTLEEIRSRGGMKCFMSPEGLVYIQEALEELRRSPDTFLSRIATLEQTHRDGHTIFVEISLVAVRDEQGKAIELCGISRDITERLRLQRELEAKVKSLEEASDHINHLQEILPICMYCHKIRTDEESWLRIEQYLVRHMDAKLSHGICPECMAKHHADMM